VAKLRDGPAGEHLVGGQARPGRRRREDRSTMATLVAFGCVGPALSWEAVGDGWRPSAAEGMMVTLLVMLGVVVAWSLIVLALLAAEASGDPDGGVLGQPTE